MKGTFKHASDELKNMRWERFDVVTTMFDLNGLPKNTPGFADAPKHGVKRAKHIEAAIAASFKDWHSFHVNLVVHEFEALLFSSPIAIAEFLGASGDVGRKLKHIVDRATAPELINNDKPPSKRIVALVDRYKKPFAGSAIATKIGLGPMRSACPHFNAWLTELERRAGA